MSTYRAETASNLSAALESIESQSLLPEQIVLVVDGPVASDQESVIAAVVARGRIPVTLVRLPTNGGLAAAMNAGLALCNGEFVMRMDSDDICTSDRLEKQLAYADAHADVDVIAAWSEEFFEDDAPRQLKVTPTTHSAIVRALRWRNVLCHPTLLVRKEALQGVDGYRKKYGYLEDYDLFVRLVLSGAKFHAIPKVLVRVRSSTAQRTRRGGFSYLVNEIRFRTELLRSGFLTKGEFIVTTFLYSFFRLLSGSCKRWLYNLARACTIGAVPSRLAETEVVILLEYFPAL